MRYARYSLATLGLVVAAIGLALAPWVNHVHFQERVIAEIQRLGGSVTYQHELAQPDAAAKPPWLQKWIGEKYFRQVTGIHLEQQHSPPIDLLDRISRLPSVETLSLRENHLTDDALRPIGRMRRLRVLRVGFNDITDKGLIHLADLHELVLLDLCVTKVTDTGLNRLQSLPKLRRLELYGDEITNKGAATLAQFPELAELDLANTSITSAGLEPLCKLPQLTDLRLDQMRLGEGQELRINDDALPHLLALPKLRDLSIVSLPISPAAIAELKRLKPGIIIRN